MWLTRCIRATCSREISAEGGLCLGLCWIESRGVSACVDAPLFWFGREAILGLAWAPRCAGLGDALKRGASRVLATGLLASTSPSCVATRAQRDDYPTSSPMTIFGLLGGAMVVSSNRQADRKPSLRHPHCPAVAPVPGSFLSIVRSGERLRWQHPPRALFGAGADGHPEASDRRPLGACPHRRQCAECSPPKLLAACLRL